MRICYIAHGSFSHIAPYLDYFKSEGHDVHFVALSPTKVCGVPAYNTGFGRKYTIDKGKWKYVLSMPRVRRIVRKLQPDIVHAHYATSSGLTSLVCNYHPTIVTVHGSDLTLGMKSRVWRTLLKAIFNHADLVNTVSEDLKEMVLHLGISADKIKALTLGIDTDKFYFTEHSSISKERALRLVCTRRMERTYNHPTIVEALVILKKNGIDFQMTYMGDGTLRESLEREIMTAHLTDSVTFLGEIDNDQLPTVLNENDVYLSASAWDGTSLSLLEAMATGVFPIVSDIKANSAWLKHGLGGLMHKVGDAKDLAKCIMRLLEQPEIAVTARENNRKLVEQRGDRNTNMKRLGGIYESLVARARENID